MIDSYSQSISFFDRIDVLSTQLLQTNRAVAFPLQPLSQAVSVEKMTTLAHTITAILQANHALMAFFDFLLTLLRSFEDLLAFLAEGDREEAKHAGST